MCVWEMATRMLWPQHGHHRAFRFFLEVQRVFQADQKHAQTCQPTNAQETARKKKKEANPQVLEKSPKSANWGNNIKIVKKINKREQEDRTSNTALSHNTPKSEARKKKTETATNCVERGTLAAKICHDKTVQNYKDQNGSKKIRKINKQPNQTKKTRMYA